jgi:hypothetical protein
MRLVLPRFYAVEDLDFGARVLLRRLPRLMVSWRMAGLATSDENESRNCHTARQCRHLIFFRVCYYFAHRIDSRFELESQIHKYPKLKKVRHLVV